MSTMVTTTRATPSASVETYGYLGKPLASYVKTISEVAAGRGRLYLS